jgi:hypothetical protein
LLKAIGPGFEVHEVNLPKVVESIYEMRDRQNAGSKKIALAGR